MQLSMQLWWSIVAIQSKNVHMNKFLRVCSCHIKAQWSDHSHDICFNWPAEVCYSADMEHDRKQRSLSDAPLPGKLGKPSASGKVRARMVSGLCNASRYLCGCLSISPLSPSAFSLVFLSQTSTFHTHFPGFICTVLQAGISLFAAERFSITDKLTAEPPKH